MLYKYSSAKPMADFNLTFVSRLAFILIITFQEERGGFPPNQGIYFSFKKAFGRPNWLCQLVSRCGDLEQSRANVFLQKP